MNETRGIVPCCDDLFDPFGKVGVGFEGDRLSGLGVDGRGAVEGRGGAADAPLFNPADAFAVEQDLPLRWAVA
ncbi:MAG: hypothetical protein CMJ47_14740 [Planctomyces sp.]|nr:hypothetical protein [Planctomyces sp.]